MPDETVATTEPEIMPLEAVERAHIATVLAKFRGNRTHTAAALGISRATLIKKIARYGL